MTPCQNCTRPAPEDAFLCRACTTRFAALPERARELITMLDQPRTGIPESRTSAGVPALPIDPEAIDLKDTLTRQLASLPPIYQEDAHIAYRDLEDTTRAATRHVDIPPEKHYLAPCAHEDCNGRYVGHAGSPRARCNTCGHTRYDAQELMAHQIISAQTWPVPLKTACAALGIPYERAKKWAQRGKITRDINGHVTVNQVQEAALKMSA